MQKPNRALLAYPGLNDVQIYALEDENRPKLLADPL